MQLGQGVRQRIVVFTSLAASGAFSDGVLTIAVIFGVFALKAVLMFSLAAYFMGVKRFYLYALLAATGMRGAESAVAVWDVEARSLLLAREENQAKSQTRQTDGDAPAKPAVHTDSESLNHQ